MLENIEFDEDEYNEVIDPAMEVAEEVGMLLAMLTNTNVDPVVRQTKKVVLRALQFLKVANEEEDDG